MLQECWHLLTYRDAFRPKSWLCGGSVCNSGEGQRLPATRSKRPADRMAEIGCSRLE
jgi:hypothetical protein